MRTGDRVRVTHGICADSEGHVVDAQAGMTRLGCPAVIVRFDDQRVRIISRHWLAPCSS